MRYDVENSYVGFRIKLIFFVIVFCFFIIEARLWNLQIKNGKKYLEISKNNQIRKVILKSPRGNIFDRNGIVLADTRPSYDLTVFLEDIGDIDYIARKLSGLIDMDKKIIEDRLKKEKKSKFRLPYIPYTLKRDLTIEEVMKVEEVNFELPGVSINVVPVRNYPFGEICSHLVGYIGKISKKEYGILKEKGYLRWDDIGKSGIEKVFEKYLRGEHGGKQVQIDNRNILIKVLGEKLPKKGNDLYLTIDIDIQKKVYEALGDYCGACLVMDLRNGDILAYVSKPGFDPNLFITRKKGLGKIFIDERHPLLDRAIAGEYSPGSTFKPVVALAGLKDGIIDEHTSFLCTGVFKFGGIKFKCWKRYGHGEVNLNKSLQQSCNVYYYNVGKELGWKPIYEMAKSFGFGEKTGFIFKNERSGILPSEEWKRKRLHQPWYRGDTINFSIGQGYLLVTPIQLLVYASALASNGKIFVPRVEEFVVGSKGEILDKGKTIVRKKINLNKKHLSLVKKGLFSVVNTKRGTGKRASLFKEFGIYVCGKTGTAQASEKGKRIHHSWFMSFAPYENPVVACVVVVEKTDSGAKYAAPVAREALKAFFEKYGKNLIKKDNKKEKVSEK